MVSESSKLSGVGGDFGCGFGCGSEQIIIHYWEQAQAKHHNTQGSIPGNLWSTHGALTSLSASHHSLAMPGNPRKASQRGQGYLHQSVRS